MKKENQIRSKLLEIITKDGVEWKVIVEEIKKVTTIKNWLLVRGIIQQLKNEKIIARTNNVWEEVYIKL
tara:strand:+ start:1881 stop:2087 length:207 start_codon:yes stop_codon:yes gene_type:complete